jgi:hypothetical protein
MLASVASHKFFLLRGNFRFVVFAVEATLRIKPRTAGPIERP